MNFKVNGNYTYIIASIPQLFSDSRPEEEWCRETLEWIAGQLDGSDRKKMEFLLEGFIPTNLDKNFYLTATADGSRFVREYFKADLAVRNAKVSYLNSALDRPEGTDVISIESVNGDGICIDDADGYGKDAAGLFSESNLLEREKAIDAWLWRRIEEITVFENFSLDRVLSVVAKICIVQRWIKLDEDTGRQMLRDLVGGIRGTYGKIEFENLK